MAVARRLIVDKTPACTSKSGSRYSAATYPCNNSIDGAIRPFNEAYDIDRVKLMYPRDPAGSICSGECERQAGVVAGRPRP